MDPRDREQRPNGLRLICSPRKSQSGTFLAESADAKNVLERQPTPLPLSRREAFFANREICRTKSLMFQGLWSAGHRCPGFGHQFPVIS
jgi:hypothetical protein